MSESDWLAAIARRGDARREGISALYTQYAERFRVYYRRRGASPADAEECCQDAFVRLVRALDQGTVVTQPRAWLWQVAKSQWLDFCRRDSGTRLDVSHWAEPADEAASDEDQHDLDDCVRQQFARFTAHHPEGAQALVWASVEQFTAPEIGQLLGRTPGATRQWLSELRKRVRDYLSVCRPSADVSS
ncbi:MAG: sigma-70 family RNA polymerase sigma factor [Pseudomonadota bacterium]|nr:sigma-70 family RNA polymerase sigma factor [Pseudomonadota bacterium]